ncbi:hypothetical protein [Polaribacter cellanae]|uniref:Uncharacterized protein n=1 Tax=Polaribacter cellanae TaxID=2818493 RepID=A0A975CSA5_9FLAO|nr:hypothetical protein [Polaribacter cellanae]QTE24367.1 hypothetical protein J3359_08925 [Polaribacter cellanae]
MESQQTTVIVKSEKSAGIAAILGFFFGPLGMLYSTGKGALIMFIINFIGFFFLAFFILVITNPICAIWAYRAAKNDNIKLHKNN